MNNPPKASHPWSINKNPGELVVGQFVTTDYDYTAEKVIRRLTYIVPDEKCGSKYRAMADGGDPCPTCGKLPADPIDHGVDAAWFVPWYPGKESKAGVRAGGS